MSILQHITEARNQLNEAEAKLQELMRHYGTPAQPPKPWRPQLTKVSAPAKAKPGPKVGLQKNGQEGPMAYWLRVLGDGQWHRSVGLVGGHSSRSTTLYNLIKTKRVEVRGGRGANREVRLRPGKAEKAA